MKPVFAKVGGVAVRPGHWTQGKLRVARHPDGTHAYLPFWIGAGTAIRGKKTVPVGALLGGSHGNEPNGPELVNRVVSELDLKELHGILLVLPVTNPWGYAEKLRMVPIDQRDLNRSYPGHATGSFTYQVADTILQEVVQRCDFVIDAHDAGDRIVLVPHARAHLHPQDDPSQLLALSFGSDVVLLREAEPGMLAGEARSRFGTTVVSLEVGGSMQVWEHAQERAKRGVFNMLRAQGMLPGQLVLPPHQHLLRSRYTTAAALTGIQTTWVALGQVVQKGQPLYRILDPQTGRSHVHRSRICGVVLAKNLSARVDKGDPAISIVEFTSCDAEAMLKADVVRNRSDRHTVVLKSAQGWSHQSHAKVEQ
ncbi:MAG: succinylglutamate desuccinylase/aspartoacylase family protein [Candidatus Andersenbacteria bacterium]